MFCKIQTKLCEFIHQTISSLESFYCECFEDLSKLKEYNYSENVGVREEAGRSDHDTRCLF